MNPLRNSNQRNMLQQFMDFKRSMQGQNPQAVLNQLMNQESTHSRTSKERRRWRSNSRTY